jgi:hypothetical protein
MRCCAWTTLIGASVRAASVDSGADRPALLVMTGDQVYCDDVAGPMLAAIHSVIDRLGLYPERIFGATVQDSAALLASEHCYYARDKLLPHTRANRALRDRFFGGAEKPIFTTTSPTITSSPSPRWRRCTCWCGRRPCWEGIVLDPDRPPRALPPELSARYAAECAVIERFRDGLARVQRALAHLPVYMIFDDHDVTDDWNLTRGWEEAAYGHPFSRRIIGNALIGYWLFQGWGNDPGQPWPIAGGRVALLPTGWPAANGDDGGDGRRRPARAGIAARAPAGAAAGNAALG